VGSESAKLIIIAGSPRKYGSARRHGAKRGPVREAAAT
jgi:hypothetical protein